MRTMVLSLAVCLALVPAADAGTADDPEITDPDGDRELADAGFTGLEIIKGWVQHTETDLLFFLEMSSDASPGSTTQYEWWFDADVGGTALSLGVVGLNGGGYEAAGDTTNFEVNGGLITWSVPRDDVGAVDGTLVSGLSAHADGYGAHGGPPRLATDRAPDEGSGRDYVIASPAPDAPPTVHRNVTEPELRIQGQFAQATNSSTFYNWTGPAHVTMELRIDGNGTVNITVLDPTGGGQFDCVCTGSVNETMDFESENGTWQVSVSYTAFTGNASLLFSETHFPDGGGTDQGNTTGTATGNTTADDSEDSPWPVALPLLAFGAAAWLRRRGP